MIQLPGGSSRRSCRHLLATAVAALLTTSSASGCATGREAQHGAAAAPAARPASADTSASQTSTDAAVDPAAPAAQADLVGREPLESPADRNARLTARDRVKRIAGELEQLRGLKFKEEVRLEIQTAADFRRYVQGMLDQELPPDLADRQSKALQAFGLLPPGYDLRQGLADLYVSQAGAYYNPETKTFYILMAGLPDDQMDSIILHELDHALEDQYHDLKRLRDAALANPSEDARTALSFVLEGEATYVMLAYQFKGAGRDLDKLPPQGQDFVLRTMRDLDRKVLLASARLAKPTGPGSDEIRKAMDAMNDMPAFLFWGLYDPYFKGQYAIFQVHSSRGWPGVTALFERLPSSTEQLLHPEKLAEPRDEPTPLTPPELLPQLGTGWTRVYGNTLGEAGMLALFDAASGVKKDAAAGGWDGDQFALYEGPDGVHVLGWWTVWDDEREAIEFQGAMEKLKAGLIGGREKGIARKIVRDGSRVTILAGPEATVARLIQTAASPDSSPPSGAGQP